MPVRLELSLHMSNNCLAAGLDIHVLDIDAGDPNAAMFVECL